MENITDNTFKKYIPVFTAICCLTSIILFIGINLEENLDTWDVYKKWGAPSVTDIFNGDYWGIITSNFLHTEYGTLPSTCIGFGYLEERLSLKPKRHFISS